MTDDSPQDCIVGRLASALDRLEIALEGTAARLREADAASAVLDAMAEDRAALAVELDAARARAAAASAAAVDAEGEVAAAAAAVRDALEGTPPKGGAGS